MRFATLQSPTARQAGWQSNDGEVQGYMISQAIGCSTKKVTQYRVPDASQECQFLLTLEPRCANG